MIQGEAQTNAMEAVQGSGEAQTGSMQAAVDMLDRWQVGPTITLAVQITSQIPEITFDYGGMRQVQIAAIVACALFYCENGAIQWAKDRFAAECEQQDIHHCEELPLMEKLQQIYNIDEGAVMQTQKTDLLDVAKEFAEEALLWELNAALESAVQ